MHTLTFTDEELQSLAGLIDAGVRATGLRGVREATAMLDKLEAATAKMNPGAMGDSTAEAE